MLKLIGVCLILGGALGVGICICSDRRSRVSQLKQLARAFYLIAGEISYSRISLPEIFLEVGEKMDAASGQGPGSCLYRIGERLQEGGGQDIRTVWQEEMSAYLSQTKLKELEMQLALSFPDAVWFLDGTRQEAAVNGFSQELQKAAQQAQLKRDSEDRMTLALCLSAGVMAAILLF